MALNVNFWRLGTKVVRVVTADSFFKIWAAGSDTVQSVGSWS